MGMAAENSPNLVVLLALWQLDIRYSRPHGRQLRVLSEVGCGAGLQNLSGWRLEHNSSRVNVMLDQHTETWKGSCQTPQKDYVDGTKGSVRTPPLPSLRRNGERKWTLVMRNRRSSRQDRTYGEHVR